MARILRRPYASLRAWREATGTKQEDLARRAGISPTHLANIEGKTRGCSLEVAMRLSRLTNVPVELIASDDQLSAAGGR